MYQCRTRVQGEEERGLTFPGSRWWREVSSVLQQSGNGSLGLPPGNGPSLWPHTAQWGGVCGERRGRNEGRGEGGREKQREERWREKSEKKVILGNGTSKSCYI